MSDEFGLTLNEAAQQLTDRELWQAYETAIKLAGRWRRTTYFTDGDGVPLCGWGEFAEVQRKNALVVERDRLSNRVTSDLFQRLDCGELIASGIPLPLKPDSERQDVPSKLFRLLSPGFRNSSLSGHGLTFVDVRIRRRETATGTAVLVQKVAPEESPPLQKPQSGRRGRPGLPPEFEAEMRRRAETGEMFGSLNQEADYLCKWGSRRFANQMGKSWAASTIRNRLRRTYNLLRAQKSCPK